MQPIGVTRYLLTKIAILAKESATFSFVMYLCRVAVRLFEFFRNEYNSSKVNMYAERIAVAIQRDYQSSFLKKQVIGKSLVQSAYENSLLCLLICKVWEFLSLVAGKLYTAASSVASGGIIDAIVSRLKTKSFFTYTNMLALYIVCMIVCPHEIWNNLYAVIAAVILLFFYLARVYLHLESPDIKGEGFGLVVFMIFVALSGVYAYDRADAVRIILFLYSAIVFGFLIRQAVNTEEKLISVLKLISVGAFATSVIGIIQRFFGVEINYEYVDVLANASMPGRVFSTFANPNNFAELLVLTMPATAALVIVSKTSRDKCIWAAFLAVDFIAIGMSYSRSCWVALAIAVVVFLLVYDWKLLVPAIIIFLIILPLLPESITDRILTIGSMKDTSNASRLYIWEGAWKMIKRYFVSGVGAGPLTFAEYYVPLANKLMATAPHSHMLYMELVIEFGIFAFIGFMSYMYFVIKRAFHALGTASKDYKAIIGTLTGSIFGMAFVFAVEYVWFYPRDMFMFWIIIGLLSAACKVARTKQNER